MSFGWTSEQVVSARNSACKHAILETFPTPGCPMSMGYAICPYCGATAPMNVRFSQTEGKGEGRRPSGAPPEMFGPKRKEPEIVVDRLELEKNYLVQLTVEGIKPLSRIEWGLTNEQTRSLTNDSGLVFGRVSRQPVEGHEKTRVTHDVFSRCLEVVRQYSRCFNGRTLLYTPDMIREEGDFFGYPECCVESFIKTEGQPIPNGLPKEDQAILFHWACPDCKETPKLVPEYRRIWQEINT